MEIHAHTCVILKEVCDESLVQLLLRSKGILKSVLSMGTAQLLACSKQSKSFSLCFPDHVSTTCVP